MLKRLHFRLGNMYSVTFQRCISCAKERNAHYTHIYIYTPTQHSFAKRFAAKGHSILCSLMGFCYQLWGNPSNTFYAVTSCIRLCVIYKDPLHVGLSNTSFGLHFSSRSSPWDSNMVLLWVCWMQSCIGVLCLPCHTFDPCSFHSFSAL